MDRNIVNIRIFDKDINFIGEVDLFTSLSFTSKFETYGEFEFHIEINQVDLFKKGNLIMLNNNPDLSGVIEHYESKEEDTRDITIKGYSFAYWFTNRVTVPPTGRAYHTFNTNVEDIMFSLVRANASDPAILNRKISNLTLDTSKHRGGNLKFQTRYKVLSDELTKLSKTSGLGWKISLDYKNKQFIFKVLEGNNLSSNQNINPPKIFSLEYDNILTQNFIDSNIGYKNMAIVAGQGEGEKREITLLNDNLKGLERRELFIDARDIDEPGSLEDRGKIKLAENKQINTFECEVDSTDYKKNWNLGDIVTTVYKEANIKNDNRVTEVREIWEDNGYKIEPTFGTPIPTPTEKIKQMTDIPDQENSPGPQGEQGLKGDQGYSLDYDWNGPNLGIKREDEANYIYKNLQGPKGDTGPKGLRGDKGDKGDKGERGQIGPQGDIGPIGVQGPQGPQGIPGLKGYTGPMGAQGPKGDVGPRGPQGERGLQGPKGDKGDIGERGPKGIQGVQGPAGNGQSYVVFQRFFISTEGQRIFTWNDGYVYPVGINAVSVYVNGARFTNNSIKEVNGHTIEFKFPLNKEDKVFIEAMQAVKDLRGPIGPQGIPGPKGDIGSKGDAGATGLTGKQGPIGPKGDQGIQGPIGPQGKQGERGIPGPQGPQGIPGPQGPKGNAGTIGPQGPKGLTGERGPIGPQGPQGAKGNTGATGPQGTKGDRGIPGPQGSKGDKGSQGPIGPRGQQGERGPIGSQGPRGNNGTEIITSSNKPSGSVSGRVWIQLI